MILLEHFTELAPVLAHGAGSMAHVAPVLPHEPIEIGHLEPRDSLLF